MPNQQQDKLINYFEGLRTHFSAYHNHKEVSAWAALALYVVATGAIASVALPSGYETEVAIALGVCLTAIAIFAWRFIINQLQMKHLGAAYVATAMEAVRELLSNEMPEPECASYLNHEDISLPRSHAELVLPTKFIERARFFESHLTATRVQNETKGMMLAILTSVSVLALFSLFLRA